MRRHFSAVIGTVLTLTVLGGIGLNVVSTSGTAPLSRAAAEVDSRGCPIVSSPVTSPTATTTSDVSSSPTATTTALGIEHTEYAQATTTSYATVGTTSAPVANCPYVAWGKGWRPKLGTVFNDPLGSPKAAQRIVRRVYLAIMHARRGSQIRIATYSFDRSEIAYALRRAKKRGVSVQVIVNSTVMSGVARSLQGVLGHNPHKRSFLISCIGRCRGKGDAGNEHDKVFAFSHTGGAHYLVITGSGNLTSKGVYRQWNDSFAVANDKVLYDTWTQMFKQMALQKQTGRRTLTYSTITDAYTYWFQRKNAGDPSAPMALGTTTLSRAGEDRAYTRIRKIGCDAPQGYGANGHTVVRVAMYAMFGSRGIKLSKLLVKKKQQGCDVKMIMSVPGPQWPMFPKNGIPVRSGDWVFEERDPLTEDGISGYGPTVYSHLKFMAISATYARKPANLVITGSENWDGLSLANEEFVLQINSRATYLAYFNQFNALYDGPATHKMGLKPTTGPGTVK